MDSQQPMTLDSPVYPVTPERMISLVDLLDYFLEQGPMRVSDLHLKCGQPPIYRVDGHLQRMKGAALSGEVLQAMLGILLSDPERQMLDEARSVDTSAFTDRMQFRLNVFYENDGPCIAVRALEAAPPAVEDIGFPNGVWRDIVAMQQGLVLLTGITGAGKSTTIASLIDRIMRDRPCRVITMEDPIEYRLGSRQGVISQREVGRDVPSFERGLRDCLREDPDVIFVGEMRDVESTAWTLTAAETGHLVFSTLHTRDARGSITRILDMFPPQRQDEVSSQLSLGLRYVISQKLVPRADGSGRVVAMEILQNSYAMGNLIRLRKLEQVYSHMQTKTKDIPAERMTTMERSLVKLVQEGVIEPLEAEKWAEDRVSFLDEMQRQNTQGPIRAERRT
jgi:twitching motility protein PilT